MPDPENKITIIVITTAEDLEREYNVNQPLKAVFTHALSLVGGQGHEAEYVLEYNDQTIDDLDRKIGEVASELGWGDPVTLELTPNPVVV